MNQDQPPKTPPFSLLLDTVLLFMDEFPELPRAVFLACRKQLHFDSYINFLSINHDIRILGPELFILMEKKYPGPPLDPTSQTKGD